MSQNRAARSTVQPGGAGAGTRTPEPPRPPVPPRPRAPRGLREGAARPNSTPAPRYGGPGGPLGSGGARPVRTGPAAGGGGLGALTGLGVALALLAASSLGALLDLFLVGGPAWALTSLYIAACGYTAGRVRRRDWYCALVAPPLAFAGTVLLLAYLMPDTFGHGLLGLTASTFELLAAKAKALYTGTALTAAVLLVRWTKTRTQARGRTRRAA